MGSNPIIGTLESIDFARGLVRARDFVDYEQSRTKTTKDRLFVKHSPSPGRATHHCLLKSAESKYGRDPSLRRLRDEIGKAEYPGLDLSHLYTR